MAHNRKLVIGGVALVKAKLKHEVQAMSIVRDEIEKVLIDSNFFVSAPFSWVAIVIRFGLEDKFQPVYQRINAAHGDLPVSVEVNTQALVGADIETMKAIFRLAITEALLHVSQKYKLPTKPLEDYHELLKR